MTDYSEAPDIIIVITGGLVEDVVVEGPARRVEVRDYDVDGIDPAELERDVHGQRFRRYSATVGTDPATRPTPSTTHAGPCSIGLFDDCTCNQRGTDGR